MYKNQVKILDYYKNICYNEFVINNNHLQMTNIPEYIHVSVHPDLISTSKIDGSKFELAVKDITYNILGEFCEKNGLPFTGAWSSASSGDGYDTVYVPFKREPDSELYVSLYKHKDGTTKLEVSTKWGEWVDNSGYII